MGQKLGGSAPFFGEEVGPHLTQSPGPRPTSIPSGILIYAAIWPQRIWAENWGAVPLWGEEELGPPSNNVARVEAYLHAKFHLDPFNPLAIIHQHYRQTGQDRQTTV